MHDIPLNRVPQRIDNGRTLIMPDCCERPVRSSSQAVASIARMERQSVDATDFLNTRAKARMAASRFQPCKHRPATRRFSRTSFIAWFSSTFACSSARSVMMATSRSINSRPSAPSYRARRRVLRIRRQGKSWASHVAHGWRLRIVVTGRASGKTIGNAHSLTNVG